MRPANPGRDYWFHGIRRPWDPYEWKYGWELFEFSEPLGACLYILVLGGNRVRPVPALVHCKIGRTNNHRRRLREHERMFGYAVEPLAYRECAGDKIDLIQAERDLLEDLRALYRNVPRHSEHFLIPQEDLRLAIL